MKIPYEIGSKKFLIKPYKTYQEKELLLLSSFGVNDADLIFDILNFKTEHTLNDNEKKLILYKHREISLGDEIDIKFRCDHCGQGNDSVIEASNFIKKSLRDDKDIFKFNEVVTDDNLQLFASVNVDELDIDEYEALKQRIKDNQITIDFIKTATCLKCGTKKKFDLSEMKYIIEIMSEDTLMTLYKTYSSMIFFGKYTKEGIDDMYPFERSIFKGLLSKIKEDLNK